MRIDASSLNNSYGVSGLLDSGSPILGGSRTSGVRATRLNVSAPSANTSDVFADIMAQKIASSSTAGKTKENTAEDTESPKDPSGLTEALSRTADFIESEFGQNAATAFKGIVLSESGETITEDSLGKGLLKSVQFIDRNFGFAAGDKVMDNFNSDLNTEINGYFENGLQEFFFAADPGTSVQLTMQNTFAQVSSQFGESTAESIKSIIEQVMEEEGNSMSALKKGLAKGLDEAEKTAPGITAATAPMAAGEIMDNLQATTALATIPSGSMLNIAV
ncbi:hypothetical protein [Maridesulfovibrio sp.]|uniref:hypothetical protein n=1 Tax=Maridesulfovibrio sp. TaxID=2795000 RepID=UPI002A186A6A|nr:hypothetical protein [Maridesulfovibrio sp.]